MAENKKDGSNLKAEFEEAKLKEELLSKAEIALWLDSYDDIFSDFDPRPFSQRALSVDFIDEMKRASRDKVSGQIEIRCLIPSNLRDVKTEEQIKKRLKDHFRKHAEEGRDEIKRTFKNGFLIAAFGFTLMFIAVLVHSYLPIEILKVILTTVLEPAGWFMMFYGFDKAFYGTGRIKPEMEFNQKMAKAEIIFVSY